ncbi:Uncharacterised protein [Acinetobacter baumannii]|nr:Uncharacterised protein [Acinetobacter baumannii]
MSYSQTIEIILSGQTDLQWGIRICLLKIHFCIK